ncbi:protein spire homolog 2-like [Acipenser ruthenus]|uniref:protein spire homolog 2-like n=1 Tax=Acipenser ruthenus TaxID=7906 RepID=UPI00145A4202|nr:protein spire homolog 2-like [Acipenser ruthenus]
MNHCCYGNPKLQQLQGFVKGRTWLLGCWNNGAAAEMARSASGNSDSNDTVSPQDRAEVRELYDPKELSLEEVLKSYEQPINEEQAWAVCYQCCRGLSQLLPGEDQCEFGRVKDPGSILLHKDGAVTLYRDQSTQDAKRKHSEQATSDGQIVQSLGFAIYRALDWGLDESEERELSPQLEQLIDLMANGDSEGGSSGTADEGYSGQEEEEEPESEVPPRTVRSFHQVMAVCAARLSNPSEAQTHYQAVCRALFVETLELQTFLIKIKNAKEMLNKIREEENPDAGPTAELDKLRHTDWTRLWVQLMRDLRNGVKLKKVQEQQFDPLPTEFELTPFEMLMQDIRAHNFKLRKVTVDGSITKRVKKDAHERILDFIRSRPPLKPASERRLRPLPEKEHTLHEKILAGIKQERKLRPVESPCKNRRNFGSLPCIVQVCSSDVTSTSCIDLSMPEGAARAPPQRPRVLLKAPTLAEMDELNISEEEESPNGEMRRVESSPVPLKRDHSFSERDLAQLQSEMAQSQSASAHLAGRGERTRSGSVGLSTRDAIHYRASLPAGGAKRSTAFSPGRGSLSSVEERSERDGSSLSKHSSTNQWMEEFSHPVESLALTIEEVINVRKVLVKAEMEKFLQDRELSNNLKKGKVCCCCRVKFPLFSWPSSCLFCKRNVCGSCSVKMKIPSKKLAHLPVYAVGFESTGGRHSKKHDIYQSLRSLSSRSVEEEFPHLYTNGCSLKDTCTECTKFVGDVIISSRKSLDILNSTPRKAQSLRVPAGRSAKYK